MKELVIISGKGGTGKTSLVAAFASLSSNHVLCDADVDAADLHLILDPQIKKQQDFISGNSAFIENEKCIQCDICRDLCRWDAIGANYEVDQIECEGCGVCVHFCPEQAIAFPENHCGEWFISETRFGPLVHARLKIAEENSGKLVSIIRQESKTLAEENNIDLMLTDGPPGIGCPVIASLGGATAVLIVVEPTVSGKHDMKRVLQLANHFKIPALVCVNKFDLNIEQTLEIEAFSQKNNLDAIGRIPFDPQFTKAMIEGKTIIEFNNNSESSQAIRDIWKSLEDRFQLREV